MLQGLRMSAIVLGVAVLATGAIEPAHAGCALIKATHSADSPKEAAKLSQADVLENAAELKHSKGWSSISLSAHKVKGDPFWKAVRPNGVPPEAQLKPDIVTARFYTTCFTGVVVPYVCTTGTSVCGH